MRHHLGTASGRVAWRPACGRVTRSHRHGGNGDVGHHGTRLEKPEAGGASSDRVRIIAILIVLCLLFVVTAARRIVVDGNEGARGLPILAAFFGVMIAYELATRRFPIVGCGLDILGGLRVVGQL